MSKNAPVGRSRLRGADIVRLASVGLRARPTRAFLSALGIAIGIAAMIAVVGVSMSSRAGLQQQLESLGTNMLTAESGTNAAGVNIPFTADAQERLNRIDGIENASSTERIDANVYRSRLIDPNETGGIVTLAAQSQLLDVVAGSIDKGQWFTPATASFPTTVLGSESAKRLGVTSIGSQVWLGNRLFTVIAILKPVTLATELDSAALVSPKIAQELLGATGKPTTVYERGNEAQVEQIRERIAPTLAPENPSSVKVSRPSDALAAKYAADQAFTSLLIAVGSIALLVGGIGVANTMIISVLERRQEIGLRRSLGATRNHILVQFISEALLLAFLGGVLGAVFGVGVTGGMAWANGWPFSLAPWVVGAGLGVTIVIGALAGVYPSIRASRISPTAALNAQ